MEHEVETCDRCQTWIQRMLGGPGSGPKGGAKQTGIATGPIKGTAPPVGSSHFVNDPNHRLHGHAVVVTKQNANGSVNVRSHQSSDRRAGELNAQGKPGVVRSGTIHDMSTLKSTGS
jgi:hypothetical protein